LSLIHKYKEPAFIIVASIFACIMLYIIEQILLSTYEIKTIFKIIFFTSIPLIYWKWFQPAKRMKEKQSGLRLSFALSTAVFSIIWLGFWLFGSFVDFSNILKELELSKNEYILRGIYIIFGNSFLEEFFFRGFIFLNLYESGYRKTAYGFSSLLFSIYHIALFQSWFSLWIMLLILLSLFAVGFVFDVLTKQAGSFKGSWMVHISADLAIILFGWVMFFA